jgi:hypothetical protein
MRTVIMPWRRLDAITRKRAGLAAISVLFVASTVDQWWPEWTVVALVAAAAIAFAWGWTRRAWQVDWPWVRPGELAQAAAGALATLALLRALTPAIGSIAIGLGVAAAILFGAPFTRSGDVPPSPPA